MKENVGNGIKLYCKTSSKHIRSKKPAVVGSAGPINDHDFKTEGFNKDKDRNTVCLYRYYERYRDPFILHKPMRGFGKVCGNSELG